MLEAIGQHILKADSAWLQHNLHRYWWNYLVRDARHEWLATREHQNRSYTWEINPLWDEVTKNFCQIVILKNKVNHVPAVKELVHLGKDPG